MASDITKYKYSAVEVINESYAEIYQRTELSTVLDILTYINVSSTFFGMNGRETVDFLGDL
jgi:hypothetical protein